MDNGKTKEVISQFDTIANLPDNWDHNQQYQKYLLEQIRIKRNIGLDIGCGTGELARKLKNYCSKVIGIDISPGMIKEAKNRNRETDIEFITTDVEEYLSITNNTFDVVISIATFHHLAMERIFNLIKTKLNKDGVLLILDLYRQQTVFEYMLSILATLCNPIMYLIKRGSLFNTKEEKNAWKDHFKYDKYSTIKEIRRIAEKELGDVSIRRHLFWRYSLIYIKR